MKESNNTGSGCPYFSDCQSCRGCEFSFSPELYDGGCRVRPARTFPDSGDVIRISGTPFFIMGSLDAFRAAMNQAIADLRAVAAL